MCRHCNRNVETLGRITGFCPLFTDNRTRRHNDLEEHKFQGEPDLFIFKDECNHIIDPTIISDSSRDDLKREFKRKRNK